MEIHIPQGIVYGKEVRTSGGPALLLKLETPDETTHRRVAEAQKALGPKPLTLTREPWLML